MTPQTCLFGQFQIAQSESAGWQCCPFFQGERMTYEAIDFGIEDGIAFLYLNRHLPKIPPGSKLAVRLARKVLSVVR